MRNTELNIEQEISSGVRKGAVMDQNILVYTDKGSLNGQAEPEQTTIMSHYCSNCSSVSRQIPMLKKKKNNHIKKIHTLCTEKLYLSIITRQPK